MKVLKFFILESIRNISVIKIVTQLFAIYIITNKRNIFIFYTFYKFKIEFYIIESFYRINFIICTKHRLNILNMIAIYLNI